MCTFFHCAVLKLEMSVSFLVFQASCVKTEPGEPGDSKPNLRRRMGSFVVKPEPGQAANGLFYHNCKHSFHPALSSKCICLNITVIRFLCHVDLFIMCFCFSCCLAEKEIPILVKQEPVEIKEPMNEADKFKSRYKKFIPPVLPSPVSWVVLDHKLTLFHSMMLPCWRLRLLFFRWIWLCVWFVVAVEKRTVCYCATAVMTATTPSAWSLLCMTSLKETGGAPSVWPRLG